MQSIAVHRSISLLYVCDFTQKLAKVSYLLSCCNITLLTGKKKDLSNMILIK